MVTRVREMIRSPLHIGVQWSFAIACSHYTNINLKTISEGFCPSYTDEELDRIEEDVTSLARNLAVD